MNGDPIRWLLAIILIPTLLLYALSLALILSVAAATGITMRLLVAWWRDASQLHVRAREPSRRGCSRSSGPKPPTGDA